MGRKASPFVSVEVSLTHGEFAVMSQLATEENVSVGLYLARLARDKCSGYKLVQKLEKVETLFDGKETT